MKEKLLSIIAVVFLSGCAMTMDQKEVNYSFSAPTGSFQPVSGGKVVKIGDFTDDRNPSDPKLMFNKTNLNGARTHGGYLAEKPIVDILEEAINSGLQSAGYKTSIQGADLLLDGELKELDYIVNAGFFTAELRVTMTVRIQLKQISDGEIIYSENLIANHIVEEDKTPEGAFTQIMDDFVMEMLESEYFRSKLR